jgi:hypothetical protein
VGIKAGFPAGVVPAAADASARIAVLHARLDTLNLSGSHTAGIRVKPAGAGDEDW